MRSFQHILDSASCYRAASAISGHKRCPESSLPPSNSNCANGALSLVTYAVWIEARIVRVVAAERRYFVDERKSVVQFALYLVGNAIAALLRINQS